MAIPILDANGATKQILTSEEVQTITNGLSNRIGIVETQLTGIENALHVINTGSNLPVNGGN